MCNKYPDKNSHKFIILLYHNKLKIISSILVYNKSSYLKLAIDSACSKVDVLYKGDFTMSNITK